MPILLDSPTVSNPPAPKHAATVHSGAVHPAVMPVAAESSQPRVVPAAPLFSRFHGLRRAADKTRRRVKGLLGKADNSPWVMHAKSSAKSSQYVDFMFGLDYLSPNGTLVNLFKEALAPYGLSFLLVNRQNVESVTRDVERGWLRPHVYLDLSSALDKRFWTLLEAADRQGVYTVGKLSALPTWTIKAAAQPLLEAAGLPLPPTVIFKKDDPDRDLTSEERSRLGEKVVVKPSFGVSGLGTVVGVEPTAAAIGKARDFARNDDWLVQKMISWTRCGDRPAYVRAYNIFGHRSLLWWGKEGSFEFYDLLSWKDVEKYDLLPVLQLTDKIAAVSGMDYFSSEVAITAARGPDRFVLIDYVNDQCDLDPESGPNKRSIPEPWARWVCQRCAEFVFRIKHGIPAEQGRSLHLF